MMTPTPCRISFQFDWEREDDGHPRAWSPTAEDAADRGSLDLYGELRITLDCGAERHELDLWEVSDDLFRMFQVLAEDLVVCSSSSTEVIGNDDRDFRMRREGRRLVFRQDTWFNAAEQRWMKGAEGLREFSVDGLDLARTFFGAARRFLDEFAASIAAAQRAQLGPFRASMEDAERKAVQAWSR